MLPVVVKSLHFLVSRAPPIGAYINPPVIGQNLVFENISNRLKYLGQLVGFFYRVLNFFRFHAGAIHPITNIFQCGCQKNGFFVGFAESTRYFRFSVNLRIELIYFPHSRQHLGGKNLLLLWRILPNSF